MLEKESFSYFFSKSTDILLSIFIYNWRSVERDSIGMADYGDSGSGALWRLAKETEGRGIKPISKDTYSLIKKMFDLDNYKNIEEGKQRTNIQTLVDHLGFENFRMMKGDLKEIIYDMLMFDMLVVRKFLEVEAIRSVVFNDGECVKQIFHTSSNQIFDHYKTHSVLLRIYCKGFVANHFFSDLEFVEEQIDRNVKSILDVGGGFGNLGKIIFKSFPDICYDCYDVESLRNVFDVEVKGLKQLYPNYRFRPGNFFNTDVSHLYGLNIDDCYDLVVLGWILHDWNDEQCVSIIDKASKHLRPGGEIKILEFLKSENLTSWLTHAMAMGRERTKSDFTRVFKKLNTGFEATFDTTCGRSIITLVPKE